MASRFRKIYTYVHRLDLAVAWGVFFILLATYWLTAAPTVSYWDCPEYVAAARLLEIGHPPGNPTWMLAERIVTMLAPAPRYVALAVNLSSGLLTAFAGFFLCRIIFASAVFVTKRLRRVKTRWPRRSNRAVYAAGAALCGSLIFGWGDSVWYSAVEAEVYAMSIFMTSVCVWLMVKWAGIRDRGKAWRYLILIAYLFGLSVGIHQLNLLCIPALAMIWGIKRRLRKPSSFIIIFLLSLGVVACVLVGMMPSTIALAAQFELFAVNTCHLPRLAGVAFYVLLLGVALLTALAVTARSSNRGLMALAVFPAIFLSGIFIVGQNFLAGAVISLLVAIIFTRIENFSARRLNLSMWMLAMLLTGYASYALIPIRGGVPSPANAQMPDQPFSFASYLAREQYGGSPLLYGATPYSRPMFVEEFDDDGRPVYRRYQLKALHPLYYFNDSTGRYDRRGDFNRLIQTPELDMWFPRVTGTNPSDLDSYRSWLGMDSASMTEVEISEAYDSLGNAVARMDADGRRGHPKSLRPTYSQHAQWLLSYQMGYMYFRYLLWNFSGRQNDIPSQGEVQNGNFITGYPVIDRAMLGGESEMPRDAGPDNPGRNRYFMLPLVLGILGAVWLARARRRGQQVDAIVTVLFVMTGLAIVVYLNQGPNEPRERDYSFLGSYFAYSVWVAFGCMALARAFRSPAAYLLPLGLAGWMLWQNHDDHDRSQRYVAREVTTNILNSAEEQAVIFVDGDNYTFPLWYGIEVEGIRPDLRIANLSYLNGGDYTYNLIRGWRDSRPLATILDPARVKAGRFRSIRFATTARDTADAIAILRFISDNPDSVVPYRYARLRLPGDEVKTIPLERLSATGTGTLLDHRRLMIFNFVAANALSPNPRQFYWLRTVPSSYYFFLPPEEMSPWMFGVTLDTRGDAHADSMLIRSLSMMRPANPQGKHAYIDETPAGQINNQRAALIRAAQLLNRRGHTDQAVRAIKMADLPLGVHPLSYSLVRSDDSLLHTRKDLGRTMIGIADSLQSQGRDSLLARTLRERGEWFLLQDTLRVQAWTRYRNALPPRLRSKMAPTR